MPVKDLTNPANIITHNEACERERHLRSRWTEKYGERLKRLTTLNREPTNYYEEDIVAHNIIGGMPTITRDNADAAYNKIKKPFHDYRNLPGSKDLKHAHSLVNLGIGDVKVDPRLIRPDTDLSPDPLMRPVDPKITRILCKPCPKFGREAYLKEREKLMPEDKYYLPECTNWDYGWRLKDSVKQPRSQYSRHWILKRTLDNRVGLAPNPIHYNEPTTSAYMKCESN